MITRIYEKEYATLDYDPSVPCVIVIYLKFIMLEEFKTQLNFGLDFIEEEIKETGRMLWITDGRLSPAIDTECIIWVFENWTPRALEAGIKHVAIVLPENEWAKMAVEEHTEAGGENGMTVTYFKDVESAKNWFRAVPM